jgi:hypothetical protein
LGSVLVVVTMMAPVMRSMGGYGELVQRSAIEGGSELAVLQVVGREVA